MMYANVRKETNVFKTYVYSNEIGRDATLERKTRNMIGHFI